MCPVTPLLVADLQPLISMSLISFPGGGGFGGDENVGRLDHCSLLQMWRAKCPLCSHLHKPRTMQQFAHGGNSKVSSDVL